jgi:purine catabolism regulator
LYSISLKQILDSPQFKAGDPSVLAGEARLDRPVRWIHISDSPNPGYLLRGGELLLTSGAAISDDPERNLAYITSLFDHGAAGLAIDFHPESRSTPTSLCEFAQQFGLPLIEFRRPVYFVELTEAVHTELVKQQHELMAVGEAISGSLFELLSRGSNVNRIVDLIARTTSTTIVVEDNGGSVLSFSPITPASADLLAHWQRHSARAHDVPSIEDVKPTDIELSKCLSYPLVAYGEVWGRLHVSYPEHRLEARDMIAINRGVSAVALTLAALADNRILANDAQGAYLRDLERGEFGNSREMIRRGKLFGVDLSEKHMRIARVLVRSLALVSRSSDIEDDELGNSLDVAYVLLVAARAVGAEILTVSDAHGVTALIALETEAEARSLIERIANEVTNWRIQRTDSLEMGFGVSATFTWDSPRQAFQDARDSARWSLLKSSETEVVFSQDLGLNHVLLKMAEGSDLSGLVWRELGPLFDLPPEVGEPLLETLLAYIELNGKVSQVARTLCVERRTVYSRLERIQKVLGVDLQQTDSMVRIYLALKGRDLLG